MRNIIDLLTYYRDSAKILCKETKMQNLHYKIGM